MKRNLLLAGLIVAALAAGLFYLRSEQPKLAAQLKSFESQVTKSAVNRAQQIQKAVQTPPPLRLPDRGEFSGGTLTVSGTIRWTNINRENNNLPPLAENAKLDLIASLRLDDLFAKQYFAHVSPTGEKAATVAAGVGYDFISLGENLALGDFKDDNDLVTAWMNSPGHRANILNVHYDQIGVAVQKGMFEGRMQWIGVQIFGRPASECLAPDSALKAKIDSNESDAAALTAEIDQKKAELSATDPRDPSYNQKVDAYNALVDQYNALLAETKQDIASYNASVDSYNTCIAQ